MSWVTLKRESAIPNFFLVCFEEVEGVEVEVEIEVEVEVEER